jgi:predicted transglutaminase-like cysteine proteinase
LLKRNLLIEAGWPEDDLVLILVYKKTTSLKTKVVQAHIALHVPSQDLVLDASPDGAKDIPQPVQKYSDFMEFNQYKLYCNIADVSTTSKARSAGDRCEKKI